MPERGLCMAADPDGKKIWIPVGSFTGVGVKAATFTGTAITTTTVTVTDSDAAATNGTAVYLYSADGVIGELRSTNANNADSSITLADGSKIPVLDDDQASGTLPTTTIRVGDDDAAATNGTPVYLYSSDGVHGEFRSANANNADSAFAFGDTGRVAVLDDDQAAGTIPTTTIKVTDDDAAATNGTAVYLFSRDGVHGELRSTSANNADSYIALADAGRLAILDDDQANGILPITTFSVIDDNAAATNGTPVYLYSRDGIHGELRSTMANNADTYVAMADATKLAVLDDNQANGTIPTTTFKITDDDAAATNGTAVYLFSRDGVHGELRSTNANNVDSYLALADGGRLAILDDDQANGALPTTTFKIEDNDAAANAGVAVYLHLVAGNVGEFRAVNAGNASSHLELADGSRLVIIDDDAAAAGSTLLGTLFFDEDGATLDTRLYVNMTAAMMLGPVFVPTSAGKYIRVTHSNDPAGSFGAIQVYFDDDGATITERFLCVTAGNADVTTSTTDDTYGQLSGVGTPVDAALIGQVFVDEDGATLDRRLFVAMTGSQQPIYVPDSSGRMIVVSHDANPAGNLGAVAVYFDDNGGTAANRFLAVTAGNADVTTSTTDDTYRDLNGVGTPVDAALIGQVYFDEDAATADRRLFVAMTGSQSVIYVPTSDGKTIAVSHNADPVGNLAAVALYIDDDAGAATDKFLAVTVGNASITTNATDDTYRALNGVGTTADAACIGQVFFDENGATLDRRFFVAMTGSQQPIYVPTSNGKALVFSHNADPVGNLTAVALYFDDNGGVAADRFLAVTVANANVTTSTTDDTYRFLNGVATSVDPALIGQVFFDEDAATLDRRFFVAMTGSQQPIYVPGSTGKVIAVTHNADPAGNLAAVALYFDDDAGTVANRLLAVTVGNATVTTSTTDDTYRELNGVGTTVDAALIGQVFFDEDAATADRRFFVAMTGSQTAIYVPTSGGDCLAVTHNADPAVNLAAVALYFDDDAAGATARFLAVTVGNASVTTSATDDTVEAVGRVAAGTVSVSMLRSEGAGNPAFVEISTTGIVVLKCSAVGDDIRHQWKVLRAMDINYYLRIRALVSSDQVTTTDRITMKVLYSVAKEGEACAAPSTALTTAITALANSAVADGLQWTSWGLLKGKTLEKGDVFSFLVEWDAFTGADPATDALYLYGVELEYAPEFNT